MKNNIVKSIFVSLSVMTVMSNINCAISSIEFRADYPIFLFVGNISSWYDKYPYMYMFNESGDNNWVKMKKKYTKTINIVHNYSRQNAYCFNGKDNNGKITGNWILL